MKNQTFFSVFSTIFFLLTTFAAAWPEAFGARPGALAARQNSGSAQPTSASQTQQNSSPAASATPAPSSDNNSNNNNNNNNNDNSNSGSQSGSVSPSGTQSGSRSGSSNAGSVTGSVRSSVTSFRGNSTSIAIDPRLPPGGVSMITPAATDGMTFVKVGDQVTFAWNYTSLSVSPSYIDVVATNTVNSQTYTIAGNVSFEQTQSVVWDTGEFTQTTDLPFVIATYTLLVYDAATDPTSAPKAGYLAAFQNLQFGVYTPQPYTPLNEFRCATCNGAMSLNEKQALKVILGTCIITILSFTWFASGLFHLF